MTLVCVLLASAVVGSTPTGENHRLIQAALLLTQLVAYLSLNLSKHWRGFIALILVLMGASNGVREFTHWRISAGDNRYILHGGGRSESGRRFQSDSK